MLHPLRKTGSLFLAAVLVTILSLSVNPGKALAHCDSAQGPVVNGAMKALETGEIKWALAYVQAGVEAEMTEAFRHALEVRKLGGEAQALADRYFAETTVRLHRIGEGAGYTGIKENPEITPGLHAAEDSLMTGEIKEVASLLGKAVEAGLEERWHRVVEAGERAEQEGTVAALREKAQAELLFELFVYGVEQAARGEAHGEESSAAGGHNHESAQAPAGEEDEHSITIQINGAELASRGLAINGQPMVPLRAVAEALGAQVAWDGATRTVTVAAGGKRLTVEAGNAHVRLNSQEFTLPMAPTLHKASVMVPGHLVADFLGLELSWHAEDRLVAFANH